MFERQFIFRENYASVKMLSADIFASVTIKELYIGVRRREFQAPPPCKLQLKYPPLSDDVIHGYEFLARPSKGFSDFPQPRPPKYSQFKKEVINPLQIPTSRHSRHHKKLQTAPQTAAFFRPLLLIAYFRHSNKFFLLTRCSEGINHVTGATSHWKSKKQPANGDKTSRQCHYSRINKRHLAGTTVFPF